MTKKLDGALFEEPAVVIGCPDYRVNGVLMSGFLKALSLRELYGGTQAKGRWKGQDEDCLIMPLEVFTSVVQYTNKANGMALLKHLKDEECIAIFYRLPRNPRVLMCGMRKPPNLFAPVWKFIQNEDTDKIALITPDTGQDGLLIGEDCISSDAQA